MADGEIRVRSGDLFENLSGFAEVSHRQLGACGEALEVGVTRILLECLLACRCSIAGITRTQTGESFVKKGLRMLRAGDNGVLNVGFK